MGSAQQQWRGDSGVECISNVKIHQCTQCVPLVNTGAGTCFQSLYKTQTQNNDANRSLSLWWLQRPKMTSTSVKGGVVPRLSTEDKSLWLAEQVTSASEIHMQPVHNYCCGRTAAACAQLGGNVNRGPGKGTLCSGLVALPSSLLRVTPPELPHWKQKHCRRQVAMLEEQTLRICFRHQQRQRSVAGSPEEMDTGATQYSNPSLLPQPCPRLRVAATARINGNTSLISKAYGVNIVIQPRTFAHLNTRRN